ncbi:MAG: hypothetical protein KA297_16740 [Kofleriaceae bacterium]|jgi:hypothetical protein|nr:hypothetical protein [Kofleriaceae bacterium]MBP6840408.1 hypothetical protein [Kofleriaceae bacterium]
MNRLASPIRLASISILATTAACASQVDGDHQGDALAELSGQVSNDRTTPVGDAAEVVVVWHNSAGSPDVIAAEAVEVEGTFPAQFSLSIYQPPADALLNDWAGVQVGVAYLVAGTPGADYSDESNPGLLGIEDDHLLVYLPAAVPAGSFAAHVLRGTPAAGFHLYGVHKLTDAEKASRAACIDALPDPTTEAIYTTCGGSATFDDFVPLPTDLASPLEIELVDDVDDVDVPNWT